MNETLQHWVVKIGSQVLIDESGQFDTKTFDRIVADLATLMSRGVLITIVSSGAVAIGREIISDQEGDSLPRLQALAAIGQSVLISRYRDALGRHNKTVAQMLLGRDDLNARRRFLNARMTLQELHGCGVVPVINENDTVATDELKFGDNDELAAMVCGLRTTDRFIILSSVQGICHVEQIDPLKFGDVIERISVDNPILDSVAVPIRTAHGRGGMTTKIAAVRTATSFGATCYVADGKAVGALIAIADGESIGTRVDPISDGLAGRKVWLRSSARSEGTVGCDGGATKAIRNNGASLLPVGITSVSGSFQEGAVVSLLDEAGVEFARGVTVYDSVSLTQLIGARTDQVQDRLGFKILDEAVHRDSLVLL